MKKVLSLAIAAALTAPVVAMADATVYGQANVAAQWVDDGSDTVGGVESYASRLGIKGSEDLGNGLKAVYKMEFGVDMDGSGSLSGRNQYVGLASDSLGTILLGRHDGPLKLSQGKFDQFNDQPGDIASVMPGEDRFPNVVAYVSPSFSGFTFVGATVAGETKETPTQSGYTSLADHWSIAGMYSNGPFYGGLAYNQYKVESTNPSLWRATFVYSGDMFEAGAMYSQMNLDDYLKLDDSTSWGLSGAVKFAGNQRVKAQYLEGDSPVINAQAVSDVQPKAMVSGGDDKVTQWTVGYQYDFSKRTNVYVSYNDYELDSLNDPITTWSLGIFHKF